MSQVHAQCLGSAIYAGRTYPVVKDFHDYNAVNSQAAQYHQFPIGQVKVIQQLLVTKTNVCAQHHAGCVAASINHLGIYALLIPVEGLGRAVAATHDVSWVDELAHQDVISMCNVREFMDAHYANQGRQPDFPRVANPNFNPDVQFRFNDHGQTIEPNAQQALYLLTGAPTIVQIGGNNAPTHCGTQPQGQLNERTMQDWNAQQQQPSATQPHQAQSQPTPLISATSQPMQSMQMPYMPPGVHQQQVQAQPQQLQSQPQAYVPSQQQRQPSAQPAQSMREFRQPAPNYQSASASASTNTIDLETFWNRLLPGKYAVLIPVFRNDKKQRDIREWEDYIPRVIIFLEAWENVPKNHQPPWYHAALAEYDIVERLKWIFIDHGNPKEWIAPLPDASLQVIFAAGEAPITENTRVQDMSLNNMQQTQSMPQNVGSNYAQQSQTQHNAGPNYVQTVQTFQQNAQ
eukprot:6469413-Amphidinium_carterae.1